MSRYKGSTLPEEHREHFQRWDGMQKVFISYSRKDMDFVRKLAGDLEKAGYNVWWDITDLRGGDDWVRQIPEAIRTSQYILVVLTPDSAESEWVQKEYTQALSLRKKIIPLMLRSSSVPFALNTLNFVNFAAGDYAENYKKLLEALGYSGEPPSVTPFEFATRSLPPALRKFILPVILGIILLAVFIWTSQPPPVVAPTDTPTLPPSPTATHTPEPFTPTDTASPTISATASVTATATRTLTPTITLTPTPSKQPFETLSYCVNSLYANTINVRSGPGTTYPRLGDPLVVGKCLTFRARNEDETWLLIAPGQTDPDLQQYEGGWIFRELLGLGLTGPIDLPVVTLTPTPTPSITPTITATFTRTHTPEPTDTATLTSSPTPSPTSPTETETPVPTETPTP